MQVEQQLIKAKEAKLFSLKREERVRDARESLADFIHLMMPDELEPENPSLSEYDQAAHTQLLCSIIEDVERGDKKRVAVSVPPQHGKTIHLSTYGPAWLWGRNPRERIIVATYNETRADELGEEFRRVIQSDTFKQIFPDIVLETGSQSKSKMGNSKGGKIFFVGLGGTVTGRTAGVFIIDDPFKDDTELQSATFRERMWKWFFAVAYSRGSKRTRIIVLHTRWHADDMIGRLCDPTHPDRKKRFEGIAEDWEYLNIPGVITKKPLANALKLKLTKPTNDKVIRAFGNEPMVALWEKEKDLDFFAQWKNGDPRTFSALVLGQPTIEDGDYFKDDWIKEYDPEDLPRELKMYGASDHAVSEKQYRDSTVLGCVGIDSQDNIWVQPDLVWDQMQTDRTVEELLQQFKIHKPELWWMESENISKSFGPFLFKRMIEERIYTTVDPITPSKDKSTRARSIQGRMSMGKVYLPRFAPWFEDARSQLLQFPFGPHDDFVDFLSLVGQGLMKEGRAKAPVNDNVVQLHPMARVLKDTMKRARSKPEREHSRGW